MAQRDSDVVLFLGDFPYTKTGSLTEIRDGHQAIRSVPGFRSLTSATPTLAIWDDHDFGPNDADGTHSHAAEALRGFQEHWPNPARMPGAGEGIYATYTIGDVEMFLLDGRYSARHGGPQSTLLGEAQNQWLRERLKRSDARYKLLVSGTPFARRKKDAWASRNHRAERDRLFAFLAKEKVTGVLAVSGDIHRTDIYRLPLPDGRGLYNFVSSPLGQRHRPSLPSERFNEGVLYSHGEPNMFGEMEFFPAGRDTAVVMRVCSASSGLIHECVLKPAELGL